MAIKTGRLSMKALLEGKTKIDKKELVGARTQINNIVKGSSADNGDYVYLFTADGNGYFSVPAANLDEFKAYAEDPTDTADIQSGKYDLIVESTISKSRRQYYTCYFEEHQD